MLPTLLLKGLRRCPALIPFLLLFLNTGILSQTYLDSSAAVNERVDDLISKMTLAEKLGQMTQIERSNLIGNATTITEYHLGSILSGGGSAPQSNNASAWAEMYDTFQQAALNTRLGIPLIYGVDAVHGHNNLKGAVIFPHNIGLGAARNIELVEEIGRITALEVAATGIDWTFAPCIAVPRNERWGRTYEGFGEHPELSETLGTAYIKGFQGDTLADSKSILACAKHYVGDGGTTNGEDQGNTEITEAELRDIHLSPYISAVNNGAGSIMASFNSWNGEKLHGHKYLLTDVLKEELGFEGFIVSDWAGINQLPGDFKSDIKESINAGIDMVMVPDDYESFISKLTELVNSGDVSTSRIDNAVRRILRIKFMLGLFENPFSDPSLIDSVGTQEHRTIARQAVRESMVLLSKKDNILPLKSSNNKIFVAGKGADDIGMQCGGWSISWQGEMGEITEGTTILEGIEDYAGSANVLFEENGQTNDDFDKAVVVIGEEPYAEGEGDREDLTISDSDIELVRRVCEKGKPIVVIILSGRPMIINPILHYSDAVIAAWLPGTEGGGVADILFGEYKPSGKLGFSWPKYMEQIPINIGDDDYDPLFEYNYGITSLEDSEYGSSPVVHSILFTESNSLEIGFNKKINPGALDECKFILKIDEQSYNFNSTPSLLTSDSTKITMTIPENISADSGQKLALSFIEGTIQAADGGLLQPFQDKLVYNKKNELAVPYQLPGKIEAEDYSEMSGIQTENTGDTGGGLNVGWIDTGDWLDYYVEFQNSGKYQLNYRVAAQSENGIISLMKEDSILKSTLLPVTSGWQNWETVTTQINMSAGDYMIRLRAANGGFNINWFSFELISNVENNDISKNSGFALEQNYPNPFNPSTIIRFSIPEKSNVKLTLYDAFGREIRVLMDQIIEKGEHRLTLNAADLASGVYFYTIRSGKFQETKKLVLLR